MALSRFEDPELWWMSLSTLSICYCSLPAFESSLLDMMPALALLKLSHNNISFSLSGAGDRGGGGGDGMDGRGAACSTA